MTKPRMDELVAGLTGVNDDRVAGPATPGARALLTAITAEAPVEAASPRRHRKERERRERGRRRLALAATAVAATAVAAVTATAVITRNSGGPAPLRDYANAAVEIQQTDGSYQVHIKNIYADQQQFHEAFAKFGLDVTLSLVPVVPARERKLIGVSTNANHIATVLNCPPGQGTACPLTLELSGKEARKGPTKVTIGRAARPGEVYDAQYPRLGDNPRSLRLSGRTVAEALAQLRLLHQTSVFRIGRWHKDGSGTEYTPPPTWTPQGNRRVICAWAYSPGTVALMVVPVKNDPHPIPNGPDYP